MLERLICIAIGYVFGLFQTGYIYGKIKHIDIREHGSGNAGATNTLRTLGWKAALITFFGDCLKCVLAILLVKLLFRNGQVPVSLLGMYAGLGAVLGHNYPFYLNFKGGKGIASTGGIILATNPVMVIISLALFGTIVGVTKYVSLGSIVLMVSFVIQVIVYGQMGGFGIAGAPLYELYGIAIFLMLLAIIRHRQNIVRLINGTENKIGQKEKK